MDTRLETKEYGWGVDRRIRKARLFKWQSEQPPLPLTTPTARELEEGKVPMRALDPKYRPKPNLLALRAKSSP
jgi:hypothetical protein